MADVGGWIVGAARGAAGLLKAVVGWHRSRPRLRVEGDWGVSSPGTLTLTVRNPGPRSMRIERLYLVVYLSRNGTRTISVPTLFLQTESLPKWIAPGEPARFYALLQLLTRRLKHHGYESRCRITPVVEDGLGNPYKGTPVAYDIPQM